MLSVVTLPGLMVVHSIDVSSSTTLCSGVMSEVCIRVCVCVCVCVCMYMKHILIGLHIVYRPDYQQWRSQVIHMYSTHHQSIHITIT